MWYLHTSLHGRPVQSNTVLTPLESIQPCGKNTMQKLCYADI